MRDAPTYYPWLKLQVMVGFLQRGGYSPRWRLLWHVAHIKAKRGRQNLFCRRREGGGGRYKVRGSPPWYGMVYLGYRGIFII